MNADEIRAYADKCAPRVLADGYTINATHVAIESTLRERHGHPSYIAELDGPGRYRPPLALPTLVRIACGVAGCGTEVELPVVYRVEGSLVDGRVVVDVQSQLAVDAWLRGHLEQHQLAGVGP